MIHTDDRAHIQVFVDACTMGCRAICQLEAYHARFLVSILEEGHPICQLEVLKQW